jgi:hypothetical protein
MTMKSTSLFAWLAYAAVLLSCSPLHGQILLSQLKRAAATEAINNARQIGLMLIEFDLDHGSFPSDETRKGVEDAGGAKLPADDKSSNSMFRQLFMAGITDTEAPFFAKIPGVKKADNDKAPGKLLSTGENAFGYIAGMGSEGNSASPILVCPLVPGTTRFDPKPFGGKAVVMTVDCASRLLPIQDDGRVLVEGVELLSKEHPVWGGKAPDIRYPALLPVKE